MYVPMGCNQLDLEYYCFTVVSAVYETFIVCYLISQTEPPPLLSSADLGLATEDGEITVCVCTPHILYMVHVYTCSDA